MARSTVHCPICLQSHPAAMRCDEWRAQQTKEREAARTTPPTAEPMDYSGKNPMVALALAEGWGGSHKFNDADLLAALHQTTGIPFMRGYILRAYDEGVIEGLPKPLDAMSPREIMRLFKTAYDRYGLLRTKEDAPVPVNAGPREGNAPAFPRFTKQAVTVDAYRLPLHDQPVPATFDQWCDAVGFHDWECDRDAGIAIKTLEGVMRADPGDWIIKGVKGEFYPCKHDIFIATYAPESATPQTGATVQGYRELQKADTDRMNVFKAASRNLVDEIDTLTREIKDRMNGPAMQSAEQREADGTALRWLAIARTHAQQATMAACRAVARPADDC